MASKTDAKGQTLLYLRDSYGRVTQVQHTNPNDFNGNPVPPTTIRTYTYDSNPIDSTYSQFASGRLTTIQYNVSGAWWNTYTDYVNGAQVQFTGDNVVEMYTYNSPGKLTGKRLRVTRTTTDGNVTAPDLNATWTYNNEGNLTGVSYPGDPNGTNPPATYSYSYDGIDRLTGMAETAPSSFTLLSGVTYNAAGQMTQMGTETRTYNAMGQLTNITVPGSLNITYNYSSTQNNGNITSQVDSLTGEQATYAYDSLNRLISAQAGTSWSQGFVYDPFGNLTDKNVLAGSAPPLHVVIDPATNHAGGEDANGNAGGSGLRPANTYDAENRMTGALIAVQGTGLSYYDSYGYDAQNKRIWGNTPTYDQISGNVSDSQRYYFYGADGKLMVQFTPVYAPRSIGAAASLTWQNGPTRVYFASRMLGNEDRLGSRGKYFPYGEDRTSPPSPPNDQVKFASYTRDSATGLDYADQRYYAASTGRFLTPDPSRRGTYLARPISWNIYIYTASDPINANDPMGLSGGEGESYCDVYPNDPACSPLPQPTGDPPPIKPDPPKQTCYIELDWQVAGPDLVVVLPPPLARVVIENPFKHKSIFVVDRNGDTHRIEAHSSTENPFGGTLDRVISDGGLPTMKGLYDTPYHLWWASNAPGTAQIWSDLCDLVDSLLDVARRFPNGTIGYNGPLGPNSNSFAYSLLYRANGISNLPNPPGLSPGWGQVMQYW